MLFCEIEITKLDHLANFILSKKKVLSKLIFYKKNILSKLYCMIWFALNWINLFPMNLNRVFLNGKKKVEQLDTGKSGFVLGKQLVSWLAHFGRNHWLNDITDYVEIDFLRTFSASWDFIEYFINMQDICEYM